MVLHNLGNSGQAMAGQANDKIQMSNKIQNPNVKMFSDMVSYLLSLLCPNLPGYRKFELLWKVFFWHLSSCPPALWRVDIHLEFGL